MDDIGYLVKSQIIAVMYNVMSCHILSHQVVERLTTSNHTIFKYVKITFYSAVSYHTVLILIHTIKVC